MDRALAHSLEALGRRVTAAWRAQPRWPATLAPLVAHRLVDGARAVEVALATPAGFGAMRGEVLAALVPLVDGEARRRLLAFVATPSVWRAWGIDALARAALDAGERAWAEALFAAASTPAEWLAMPLCVAARLDGPARARAVDEGAGAIAAAIAASEEDLDVLAVTLLDAFDGLPPERVRALAEAIAARLAVEEVPWFDPGYGDRDARLVLAELYARLGDAAAATAWIARAEADPYPFGAPPAPPGATEDSLRVRALVEGKPPPVVRSEPPWPAEEERDRGALAARLAREPDRLQRVLGWAPWRARWEALFSVEERRAQLAPMAARLPPALAPLEVVSTLAAIAGAATAEGRARVRGQTLRAFEAIVERGERRSATVLLLGAGLANDALARAFLDEWAGETGAAARWSPVTGNAWNVVAPVAAALPTLAPEVGRALAALVLERLDAQHFRLGEPHFMTAGIAQLVAAIGDARATELWRARGLPVEVATLPVLPPSLRAGEVARLLEAPDVGVVCAASRWGGADARRTALDRVRAALDESRDRAWRRAQAASWLYPLAAVATVEELVAIAPILGAEEVLDVSPWLARAMELASPEAIAALGPLRFRERFGDSEPNEYTLAAHAIWNLPDDAGGLAAVVPPFVAAGGRLGPSSIVADAVRARGFGLALARVVAADPSLRRYLPDVVLAHRAALSADELTAFAALSPTPLPGTVAWADALTTDGTPAALVRPILDGAGPAALDAFLRGVGDALPS